MVAYYYNNSTYPAYYTGDPHEDEEWDRSSVLDPLWEVQQKKTFTAWCNSHLRKAGTKIENLEEDFQNGLKLMLLIEVISGERLQRPDRGRTRFHRIANVNKALDFIRRRGVKLVSLGAEAIVDGNQKMILGLIWTLILRFAIQNITVGDLSARDGLLLWCQRKTEPYQNVDIQNFSNSWRDGLAFCALIHRHRPELIDYNSLNAKNPVHNLNLAFDVAEKHLDIPPMLDANEMVEMLIPDEKSLMAYVSSIYSKFTNETQLERAVKRVVNELETDKNNKRLADDYDKTASDLLQWIDKWTPWLKNRNADHSLDDAQRRLNEFRRYRLQEKPNRVEEKSDLENLHNRLQTQLKLADKLPFKPKNGQLIEDINNAWQRLEGAEKGFEDWLLSEVARLERLEHLAQKFAQKYAFYTEWADGKDDLLSALDFKTADSHGLKCLRKKHEFFESELANHQERVEQMIAIGKELARLRYPQMDRINRQCSNLCDNWQLLTDLSAKRRQVLADMAKVVEKLDDLHFKFASLANPFNNWASSTREDLVDLVIVTEMREIEQLLADHNGFKETIPDADSSMKEIMDLNQQIQQLVQSYGLDSSFLHNPYTDLTANQLSNLWTEVQSLIPRRDTELEQEHKRQKNNERLRLAFVEHSNKLGPWLESQLETVLSIGMTNESQNPQKLIDQLSLIRLEVQDKRAEFNELEQISQQLQENFVFSIPESKYTMQSLRVGVEALLTSISKATNDLKNQLLIIDAKQKEDKQLDDYRQSFNHFDKNQKGLNEEQLRAFLVSIGQNTQDERVKEMVGDGKTAVFNSIVQHLHLGEKSPNSQLNDAFRLLANGKTQIGAEDIRREFASKQAEECLAALDRHFDHASGQYNYNQFCRQLYS